MIIDDTVKHLALFKIDFYKNKQKVFDTFDIVKIWHDDRLHNFSNFEVREVVEHGIEIMNRMCND